MEVTRTDHLNWKQIRVCHSAQQSLNTCMGLSDLLISVPILTSHTKPQSIHWIRVLLDVSLLTISKNYPVSFQPYPSVTASHKIGSIYHFSIGLNNNVDPNPSPAQQDGGIVYPAETHHHWEQCTIMTTKCTKLIDLPEST